MRFYILLISIVFMLSGCVRSRSIEIIQDENSQGSIAPGIDVPPIANDMTPTSASVLVAKTITLDYTDANGDLATSCVVSDLVNANESTPCACLVGVCTVGITSTAEGVVTFSYQVTAAGVQSNLALASLSSKVGVSVSDIIVNEWGVATLNVNLSAASVGPITVDFASSDASGTAVAGTDFVAVNSTLTIPAGITRKSISVPILNNMIKENDRDFLVNLTNISNANLLNSTAKVTIQDNDFLPIQNLIKMDAGGNHTCAILGSGAAKCWGYSQWGQVGDSTTTSRYIPTNVIGLDSGTNSISGGTHHTCAVLASGAAKCWGRNAYGQLGDNTQIGKYIPTDVSGLGSNVGAIAAGDGHSCALLTTGAVKCWGRNIYGQIGDNTVGTNRLIPTDVSGLGSGVVGIATGEFHSCALLSTGAVKCWGDNASGEIGDNSTTQRLVPTDVTGLGSGVLSIACGAEHTCALLTTGAVKCWGANSEGQLGDNTSGINRLIPTDVIGLSGVVEIATGAHHTCALLSTGTIKCWGGNSRGEIGDGTVSTRLVPTEVSSLGGQAVAITVGSNHSCALLPAGTMKCWGKNDWGQTGIGVASSNRIVPTDVLGLSTGVTAISARAIHTCALLSTGGVRCWGNNDYGQVGNNASGGNVLVPVDVSGLSSDVISIASGENHTCVLLSSGGVKCWGNNNVGQLGDNSITASLVPSAVPTLTSDVSAIVAGSFHNCALLTSGAVKCWGGE